MAETAPAPAPFGQWHTWAEGPKISEKSLREILDGGQTFRWSCVAGYFEGRWARRVVRIRTTDDGLDFSVPETVDPLETRRALDKYFACGIDFAKLADQLPHRNDPVLKAAIAAFPGLRILRQPFGETLFSFLCSSTKQIPQIKAIHEAVAGSIGDPLPDGSRALPTWQQIARAGETTLRAAKLGYRARYIYQTACFLQAHPDWLDEVEQAPTEIARNQLLGLPGVGRKIADCVLLFGAGRLEAFPIDTWVRKILVHAYGLDDWTLPQLQQFSNIHFAPAAGYAQQYLFAAARDGTIPTL